MNNVKINYLNKELIKNIFNNMSKIGISFVLLTSGSNIAYAKEGSTSHVNSDITMELDVDSVMKKYNNAFDFQPVFLPSSLKNDILLEVIAIDPNVSIHGIITVGHLRQIECLDLDNVYGEDLSFLNYCTNLKYLSISGGEMGSGISQLPNLKELKISTYSLDFRYLKFINSCNSNINVSLSPMSSTNVDLLPYYKKINNLSLLINDETNVDLSRLSYLKKFEAVGLKYDIPIHFSTHDYDILSDSGVSVSVLDIDGNDIYDDFVDINDKLDDIVDSLNVPENATPQEKMDAILVYVLENCNYDPEIAEKSELYGFEAVDFYDKGYLDGFFNHDTQICGNYTAITNSLAHRLGIESYMMYSDVHSWSLIYIDGEYYFYDATVLDASKVVLECKKEKSSEDTIKDGIPSEKEKLFWYMVDYDDYEDYIFQNDSSFDIHNPENLPYVLTFEKQDDNNVKVSLSSNRVYTIPRKQMLGILSSFGFLKPVMTSRARKEKEQKDKKNYR